MTSYFTSATVIATSLSGILSISSPARADHCTIAVTTELSDFIRVRVPNSIYDAVVVLDGQSDRPVEPIVAHGQCPGDPELLFVVWNCTLSRAYEYKTFPEDEIDGIPLYVIREPFDDDFDGWEGSDNC